jgi:hypothetical protein
MRWFRRVLLLAAAAAVIAAFPAGPLFPWSPVKPGYSLVSLDRADIFYPTGTALDPSYRQVDAYISAAEEYHRLEFRWRMTIIACRNWEDFSRFLPTVRNRAVGAATLETGTVIYVTPKIREARLDTGEFLRHELSHAVMHQHQAIWNAFEAARQAWLLEGMAVGFGDQKSYLSEKEFRARARGENLVGLIDPEIRLRDDVRGDTRFLYPAWRYYLEFLIKKYGRDRFQLFLVEYLRHPGDYQQVFQMTYSQNFRDSIHDFQESLSKEGGPRTRGKS